jgi:4-hydroxy-3-methylbut-2-enyl diphosphate reductase
MHIHLANPRGFCAGVDRAIAIVERALEQFGTPVYVRHEVVHNRFVVDSLRERGAVFVEELHEVPDDAIVIFSAHGVSQTVRKEAARRGLNVFDATCPLVTKVHIEVVRHSRAGRETILIGHAGHPEVEGTMGQYDIRHGGHIYLVATPEDAYQLEVNHPDDLAYVTQTTLSVDDTIQIINILKQRFPAIQGPRKNDICYATQNRQDAVRELAQQNNVVLVVGSKNSSNSNRLRELAEQTGKSAYLIDKPDDIDPGWLTGSASVGVTAGASAPEQLVQQVIERLRELGADSVTEIPGRTENVMFALPKGLR